MRTIDYLTDPVLRGLYLPVIVAGLAIAALCGSLSVLVVLRRLAFVGQGISHAALGGIGVAAALGLLATGADATGARAIAQFGVVLTFCVGAGLLISVLSQQRRSQADTAIGVVLVSSMALGAVLLHAFSTSTVSWESFLFGSILAVSWSDAAIACAVAGATLLVLWSVRRPLIFWAFDPPVAQSLGVSERRMSLLLMFLLSLATVTAMKLAGVVLATAMLVLPGAVALRLSVRGAFVFVLALGLAVVGVLGGLLLSFELNWLPGASIVLVLSAFFAAAWSASALRQRAG